MCQFTGKKVSNILASLESNKIIQQFKQKVNIYEQVIANNIKSNKKDTLLRDSIDIVNKINTNKNHNKKSFSILQFWPKLKTTMII